MASKGVLEVTAACLVFLLFLALASCYSLTPTNENLEYVSHTHGAKDWTGWPSSLQEQLNGYLCPATCPACPACQACPSSPSCPLAIPPGYKYYPNVGYYKMHYEFVNWTRARGLCEAEGGHLLVINSQVFFIVRSWKGADIRVYDGRRRGLYFPSLTRGNGSFQVTLDITLGCEGGGVYVLECIDNGSKFTEEADLTSSLMRQYGFTSYYHIGFYDATGLQTFVTIFDDLLSASGYFTWAPGEPNGPGTSLCGAFGPNSGLDDIECQNARPFVCELLT